MRQLLRNYFSSLNAFLPGRKHRRSRRASGFRDVSLACMEPLENRLLLTIDIDDIHLQVDTGDPTDKFTSNGFTLGKIVTSPTTEFTNLMVTASFSSGNAVNFSYDPVDLDLNHYALVSLAPPALVPGPVTLQFTAMGFDSVAGYVMNSKSFSFTYVSPLTIENPGPLSSWEGNAFGGNGQGVQITAHDDLGLPFTFGQSTLPPGLSISSSGLITGTPTSMAHESAPMHDGVYHVTINATDSAGNQAWMNFDLTIWDRNPIIVTNPGTLTNSEGDAVNRPIMATSPQNQPIHFAQTGLPQGLDIDQLTGNITPKVSWTAYESATGGHGVYHVTINASDASGATGSTTFDWNITSRSPITIMDPGNQSSWEGNPLGQPGDGIPIMASHLENKPVTFTIFNAPVGVNINAANGVITGTPNFQAWDSQPPNGDYNVLVRATDADGQFGERQFTLRIFDRNPIVIDNPGTIESFPGEAISMTIATHDPQNLTVTCMFPPQSPSGQPTGLPMGLMWDMQGHITGTIDSSLPVGTTFTVLVRASDASGATDPDPGMSFQWHIVAPRPTVTVADQTVREGNSLTFPLNFTVPPFVMTDPTFTFTGLPAWLQFDPNPIPGQPNARQFQTVPGGVPLNAVHGGNQGSYAVSVTIDDGQPMNNTATDSFTIHVQHVVPTITSPTGNRNDQEMVVLSPALTVAANDPDGDSIWYDAPALPSGLSINHSTGAITGMIAYGQFHGTSATSPTIYPVTFTATVGQGTYWQTTATKTIDWGVWHAKPQITTIANQSSIEGTPIDDLNVTVTSMDGPQYPISDANIHVTGLPDGIQYDPVHRKISGTPSLSSSGTYTVHVNAEDSLGEHAQELTFTWTVGNLNNPPVFTSLLNRLSKEDEPVSYSIAASDPDGDTLTFGVPQGYPAGITFNQSTGVFSGHANFGAANQNDGLYSVQVSVSDGHGHTTTGYFNWKVIHQPIEITVPHVDPVKEGDYIDLQVTATDPNVANQPDIRFSWSNAPAGLSMDEYGHITGWISPNTSNNGLPRDYTITVDGDDGHEGSEDTDTFVITVGPHAPIQFTQDLLPVLVEGSLAPEMWVHATNPNNNPLPQSSIPHIQFSVEISGQHPQGLPPGLSIDSATGAITGVPTIGSAAAGAHNDPLQPHPTDPGKYLVTIVAQNGYVGSRAEHDVTISVDFMAANITSPGHQESEDGDIFDDTHHVLQIAASSLNGDPVTVNVTGGALPTGLHLDPMTRKITGTVSPTASTGGDGHGNYTITVTASSAYGRGHSSEMTFTWTVLVPPPVIEPIEDRHDMEETAVVFELPERVQPISFSSINPNVILHLDDVQGLPSGMDWEQTGPNSGEIRGRFLNGDAEHPGPGLGEFPLTVIVSDDRGHTVTEQFIWTADAPAPTLQGPLLGQFMENDDVSWFVPAVEPDPSNTLTYSFSNPPIIPGLDFDYSTGEFHGRIEWGAAFQGPNNSGFYSPLIHVTDLHGQTATAPLFWTVSNYPPELDDVDGDPSTPILDPVVRRVRDAVDLQITATAPNPNDPPNFTFTAENLPSSLHMDESGHITGTLVNDDCFGGDPGTPGVYTVTVTVDDHEPANNTDTETFTLIVKHVPPVLNQPDNQTDHEREDVRYSLTARQPQGDRLTFSWEHNPAGLTLDPTTGLITGSAEPGTSNHTEVNDPQHPGRYHITATVRNDFGDSDTKDFYWTILHSPPELDDLDNQNDPENTIFVHGGDHVVQITADSPDGDTLTYVADNLPTGLQIDIHTGEITGEIDYGDARAGDDGWGHYQVTITVTDQHGASDSGVFQWTVYRTVFPPTIQAIPDQSNYEGNYVRLPTDGHDTSLYPNLPLATDPQGFPLSYSAEGLPDGLSMDVMTGAISGTISVTAIAHHGGNTFNVTVTATQVGGAGLSDDTSFTWTLDHATLEAESDPPDPNADPKYPCPCALMQPSGLVTDGPVMVSVQQGTVGVAPLRYVMTSGTDDPATVGDAPEPGRVTHDSPNILGDGQGYSPDPELESSLPAYYSAGDGHPIFGVKVTIPEEVPDEIVAVVTFDGVVQPAVTYLVSPEQAGHQYELALQVNLAGKATGHYQYSVNLTARWNVNDPYEYHEAETEVKDKYNFSNNTLSSVGSGMSLPNVSSLVPGSDPADPENGQPNAQDGMMLARGNMTAAWYVNNGDGTYQTPANSSASLVQNLDGTYTLSEPDGRLWQYDDQGVLTSESDVDGFVSTYTYDAYGRLTQLAESGGRTFSYTYDAYGLSTVADSRGGSYHYTHDLSGRITSLTAVPEGGNSMPGSPGTSSAYFGYDNTTGLLNSITDPDNNTTSITYGAGRRVQSVSHNNGTGKQWSIEPVAVMGLSTLAQVGNEFTVTRYHDPLNHTWVMTTDKFGNVVETVDPLGRRTENYYNAQGFLSSTATPAGTTSMQYDADGHLITMAYPDRTSESWQYAQGQSRPYRHIDQAGNITNYTYDSSGNLLQEAGPLGRTTIYTYGSHREVLTMSNSPTAPGQPWRVTTYTYDSQQNLVGTLYPDGSSTSSTYDSVGRLTSDTDELTRTTTYTYDGLGRVQTVTPPALDSQTPALSKTYAYDKFGRKASETRSDGFIVSYLYNPDGQLTQLTNGMLATSYTYDFAGNLKFETNPKQQTTTYEYNAANQLTKITLPRAGTELERKTTYEYNSWGLVSSVIDAFGNHTDYTYDRMGRVLTETDAVGHVTHYTYDALGRQSSLEQPSPDGIAPTAITRWQYNAYGELTKATDANGNVTQRVYDGAGNLVKIIQPAPAPEISAPQIQYTFDAVGRMLKEIDPLGRQTQYAYDPAGQLTTITQADGSTRHYTYDGAGHQLTATDERGFITRYAYNAAGDLVSEQDPLLRTTTYTYDTMHRLSQISRPSVGMPLITGYTYDELGRVVSESRPGEGTTNYEYNSFGEVTKQTDGMNRATKYEYDQLGRVTRLLDPRDKPTDYEYDVLGNLVRMTDRNRNVTQYAYDRWNRLITVSAPAAGTRTTKYDALGNVISQTDNLGHETKSTYDRLSRLVSVLDPAQGTNHGLTTYTYDAAGNRVIVRDPLGNKVFTTYDPMNRPLTIGGYTATPTGGVLSSELYTYDPAGNVLTHTNSQGIVSSYAYNQVGDMTDLTDAAGHVTHYTYDPQGHVLSVAVPPPSVGQSPLVTSYEYDDAGRLVKQIDPLQANRQWMYNNDGELIAEQDEMGRHTSYAYDEAGRRSRMYSWDTTDYTAYTYDDLGNVLTVKTPLQRTTTYTYDAAGRKLSEADPAGRVTSYTYDANGSMLSLTDPVGNISSFTYDVQGRQVTDTNVQGTRTYKYDGAGHLTRETDRNGRIRDFDWDFAYDGGSNYRPRDEVWLVETTVPGNPNPVLLPTAIITYAYNPAGQLASVADANSSVLYTYDALGRVASTSQSGGTGTPVTTLTNTYDNAGRRVQLGTNGGLPRQYTYDAASRMTSVRDQFLLYGTIPYTYVQANLTYNPDGQINTVTRSKWTDDPGTVGVTTQYAYDQAGRISSMYHMLTEGWGLTYIYNGGEINVNGALMAFNWQYNADGQIAQSERGAQVGAWDTNIRDQIRNYTYDASGQLTGVATSTSSMNGSTDTSNQSYGYDANGNRNPAGYDTDAGNLMLSDGEHTYTYDAEGNRLTMTKSDVDPRTYTQDYRTTYTWDYRNRLTSVTETSSLDQVLKQVTYTYDAFDRRISKTVVNNTGIDTHTSVERYVYDGQNLLLTLDGDGAQLHRYLQGPEVDQVFADDSALAGVLWLLEDNQHSIEAVVGADPSTDPEERAPRWNYQSYDAFGNQTVSDPTLATAIAYTGQVWDADAHLYYYKARWYDAVTGRFISSDPLGFAAGDTNLQRYVENDPINATDPSGLASKGQYKWHWHHRYPKEVFTKEFLDRHGLNLDIDSYNNGMMLQGRYHTGAGGLHPRGYNDEWKKWVARLEAKGVSITEEMIKNKLYNLERKYSDLLQHGKRALMDYSTWSDRDARKAKLAELKSKAKAGVNSAVERVCNAAKAADAAKVKAKVSRIRVDAGTIGGSAARKAGGFILTQAGQALGGAIIDAADGLSLEEITSNSIDNIMDADPFPGGGDLGAGSELTQAELDVRRQIGLYRTEQRLEAELRDEEQIINTQLREADEEDETDE